MGNELRKSNPRKPPTRERVQELLAYDPLTGVLRWKVKRGSRAAGQVAGTINADGYLIINIDGHGYRASQIAWLSATGDWHPFLDHRNRQTDDNRLANLRPATRAQNGWNRRAKLNKRYSDHKGVSFDRSRGKWTAQISADHQVENLGRFDSEEQAISAYRAAAVKKHGEFVHF
jgi:hypothetical protein